MRSVLHEADIHGKTSTSVLSSDANKAEGSVEADAETSAHTGGVREMVLPSTSFNFTNISSRKNAMITTSAAATSDDVNRGSGDRILLRSAVISRIVELDG